MPVIYFVKCFLLTPLKKVCVRLWDTREGKEVETSENRAGEGGREGETSKYSKMYLVNPGKDTG